MKRFALWLAVLCLWTAAAAVWPGTAVAEVAPGFEPAPELKVPEGMAPTAPMGTGESALPDGTFTAGGVNTEAAQPGGFRSWWQKQGGTLGKGFGAGVVGAGIVVLGALALGLGAPVVLAGAGFAVLGGAIYGATVDPASFSWGHALGVSVFSGASAVVGAGSLLPAVGRTAGSVGAAGRAVTGVRGLFGRGVATSAPRSGLVRALVDTVWRSPDAAVMMAGAVSSNWDFIDDVYGFSDAARACDDGLSLECAKAVGSTTVKIAGTVAVGAAVEALAPAVAAGGEALASGAGLTGAAVAASTSVHTAAATEAGFVLGTAAATAAFSDGDDLADAVGDGLEGAAFGQVMGWAETGKEFKVNKNLRIAPFGNRTNNPLGQRPHYHRRITDAEGKTVPGGGIGKHRPWEGGW